MKIHGNARTCPGAGTSCQRMLKKGWSIREAAEAAASMGAPLQVAGPVRRRGDAGLPDPTSRPAATSLLVAAWLERYLQARERFREIRVTLFAHGVDSVGIAGLDRWRGIVVRTRTCMRAPASAHLATL